MIRQAKQHSLQFADLGKPSKYLNIEELRDNFNKEWERNGGQSFIKTSVYATRPLLWVLSVVFYTLGILLNFTPSIILEQLVKEYDSANPSYLLTNYFM